MHHATSRFWNSFGLLPENIQEIARKNFSLLKNDPSHPSLHFKKVGKLWSARVGTHHRALAVPDRADFLWVWIGTHDEYMRLIKQEG
ncbi:MAG TPA: hypothetical protein VG272_09940 [Candidatus Acidoferrales bacterium]|jgi:hypothetical protein|nr:hypothetical protein [Candidatus Acidoferrales bacterium]